MGGPIENCIRRSCMQYPYIPYLAMCNKHVAQSMACTYTGVSMNINLSSEVKYDLQQSSLPTARNSDFEI